MQLVSDQFDAIQKLIGDLKRESEIETTLIIVEGRKDLQALQNLGIKKNILHFQGRSMAEIADISASFKKIIILTDFDSFGHRVARDLYNKLNSRGLNADLKYYFRLRFFFKSVSKDIESIFRIYQQIQYNNLKRKSI